MQFGRTTIGPKTNDQRLYEITETRATHSPEWPEYNETERRG